MKFIRNLFFVLSILAGTNPTPAQAFELTKGTDKVTVTLYTNYDEINPVRIWRLCCNLKCTAAGTYSPKIPGTSAYRPRLNGVCRWDLR